MAAPLPSVAIIGRPNVGKSALFNRLVGRKIAIVHDQPGITRDRLAGVSTRGARNFNVFDTGGVAGAGESELLRDVVRVVGETIQLSDVLLFVVDGRAGLSPLDQEIARMVRKSRKPLIVTINKIDNDKQEDLVMEFDSLGFDRTVSISAEHNRGISELITEIENLLPQSSPVVESPAAGKPLQHPLAVSIVGRPNVGKSSLINAIVRDERAIVSELAGTTRDAIDIAYERKGENFLFIDTAGMRRRSRHSSSVEVFSVMRAERSIRRADLCVLTVDLSTGVTAQDKRIAGLIQEAHKACAVVLNKWDLIKPSRHGKRAIQELIQQARDHLFFVAYAPVVIASAATGENVDRLFGAIHKIRAAARLRIGTGVLNRLLRAAIAANPPPMRKGKRLKLFYGAQSAGTEDRALEPPQFVLFVNDPRLLPTEYKRYLIARIRDAEPFEGLPILLTLRGRSEKV
jgi:GTP-binding protein